MISRSLEVSLNRAVHEAQKRRHLYVSVEHILYALLDNREAKRAILACGGKLQEIRLDVEEYFREKIEIAAESGVVTPQPTLAFQRVLQVAAQQVVSSGKEQISGSNLLIAMYSEKESFAVYYLLKHQVSKFDLLNYVSHGTIKDGVDPKVLEERNADDSKNQESREIACLNQSTDESGNQDERTKSRTNNTETQKKNSLLNVYTTDLCAKAREGGIDPLIGRSNEIERTIQVLCRRRKNNPLFVGESGVGKTALAQGLALKIVNGEVPEPLKTAKIYSLEMGTLLAGTKFRGDFEQRLKSLINELIEVDNSILFVDEIHTIMGAGAVNSGSLDASNILKPFLSNGDVRCIGSTTYKEYRQQIENDHALSRRFQKISIEEPGVDDTIKILHGVMGKYEEYHGVKYSREAVRGAVNLSRLHLRDRRLPDKAIDVLDEAGAAWRLKGSKTSKNVIGLNDIKVIVAKMARIPQERMSTADKEHLKNLGGTLKKMIFGQDQAVEALDRIIRMSRSGLGREDKPIGSFLFSGPTGVGKTELAKQLAQILGVSFLRFDMSEYMERHAVSRLIGAPPGYVGYDEGGLLTDAVTKSPYSVLLLDEIEKAHPDVHNILLQVMDHGSLTDSNGRLTDFRNTIVIMTTNVGAEEISKIGIGFNDSSKETGREKSALRSAFSPEFRNRLDEIVSFNPLPEEVVILIVEKLLKELDAKLRLKRVKLSCTIDAKKHLANEGFDPAYGARPLARIVDKKIKQILSDEILFGKLKKGGNVTIDFDDNKKQLTFKY